MPEHVIASLNEIPQGEGRAFAINGCQIAVFRLRDDSVHALDAVCPHRGGPLADALIDDDTVVCPLHGYTYRLDSGTEIMHGGRTVTTYAVWTDASGQIWMDDNTRSQPRHDS